MKVLEYRELGVCDRCKNEKEINEFHLCQDCDEQIHEEYLMLYTKPSME